MNKTKIEWTDYSWNPVVGCKNNCWYCYGKRMNDRFKWIKKWKKPKFFADRLYEPGRIKKPSKIFVCSMADLFGDWVPKKWIKQIIKVAKENPQHTFQFLTKNPKRYLEFKFPKNCWLGMTIDYNVKEVEDYNKDKDKLTKNRLEFLKQKDNYKFISFEPLIGNFSDLDLSGIDQVIIGAMTGNGEKNVIPEKEWIDSIRHPNIFYKDNIKKYLTGNKENRK